jgi:hypothetical protein
MERRRAGDSAALPSQEVSNGEQDLAFETKKMAALSAAIFDDP